jgi:superfamily II DNA or RNA helicase
MLFPDQDSTNFPLGVLNNLTTISQEYTDEHFLKFHQFIVYEYMIKNVKNRGLLIFHEMGMGKSITAVALAEYYRKHDPGRNIVILLSKSLQENFKKNIKSYAEKQPDHENIDNIYSKYKFVSLNASNMYVQMSHVDKTKEEMEVEKQLKEFTDIVENKDFLENTLLIIDEFHNLSNSITNGSYNALRLYDSIMATKNIKLMFLTGTPIVNNPFELVPTFNMLRAQSIPLFPELKKDFDGYFIDERNNRIKNAEYFKNRIVGMVSYYGNQYFEKKKNKDFPEEYPIIIVKVPMSDIQFSRYNATRDLEIEEAAIKGRPSNADRFSNKSSTSSSYRVKSRQISNYLIPEYALGPIRGNKARVKHIDKISDKDLLNMASYSPKFLHIMNNIKKHKNQLGLFYSEFVSGEGISIFSRILDLSGYSSVNTKIQHNNDLDSFDLIDGGAAGKHYAIISGDISMEDRVSIIKKFNNPANAHGKFIELLLISKTGAEGLDLKNIRHIHICEPYWNMARIEQIIARGVRYKSHIDLPKTEQNVQSYIYLSDYPKDYELKKKKEETTDIELYNNSIKNKVLIDQFLTCLIESSIDCSIHQKHDLNVSKKIKCKLCSPNNKKLYHPLITKDLLLPNPCDDLKQAEIKVNELIFNDTKYYYSNDLVKKIFNIFKYDDTIQGYVQVQDHEPVYSDLLRKLLKLN